MSWRRVQDAVANYSHLDPSSWQTGLSTQGAQAALHYAAQPILTGPLPKHTGTPPEKLLIWCSANVFTAPLEWTALFSSLGSAITLRPSRRLRRPIAALVKSFQRFNLPVSMLEAPPQEAQALLPDFNALLAFGGEQAMESLQNAAPPNLPTSLHGHKISLAIVSGEDPKELGRALALDVALYDGQGCMSPVGIFCLKNAAATAKALAEELKNIQGLIPVGQRPPDVGIEWRRRVGLSRILGTLIAEDNWAVPLLPSSQIFLPPLPRMIPVYSITEDEIVPLNRYPISTCATDIPEHSALARLNPPRICQPGQMQLPPFDGIHDGVNVLEKLAPNLPKT